MKFDENFVFVADEDVGDELKVKKKYSVTQTHW